MRLIDADALKDMSVRYFYMPGDQNSHLIKQWMKVAINNCIALLDNAPTIDAVEVVHGRWEKEPPYTSLGGEYKKALICSECHSFFVSDGNKPWQLHNYCPNCGAKMDGEREEP